MDRPYTLLAYAQSLDGSLATVAGGPLTLSGPEALAYTHALRAAHQAILVGIGTVLADDPQLTVRLAPGEHPQPIVLDSQLRFPLGARLWQHPTRGPWILTTPTAPEPRRRTLEERGARVVRVPADAQGRVNLKTALGLLRSLGIARLMIEGGARVITAVLAGGLADRVSVTIAARYVGGRRAYDAPLALTLTELSHTVLGSDLIIEGTPGPGDYR
jgi:3,4-dihydroxy 2-butanone 4-phosphate synthase/GTP cyclohydrolase II